MKLTCEALPDVEDATPADIERIIGGGIFGGYAVLHKAEEEFLQVGLKGRPPAWAFNSEPGTWERDFAEGCRSFTERTGSQLWGLDYIIPTSDDNFEADGYQTLPEVTRAFLEYLRGEETWRTCRTWTPSSQKRGRLPDIPH